jgi:hypothetical protein
MIEIGTADRHRVEFPLFDALLDALFEALFDGRRVR